MMINNFFFINFLYRHQVLVTVQQSIVSYIYIIQLFLATLCLCCFSINYIDIQIYALLVSIEMCTSYFFFNLFVRDLFFFFSMPNIYHNFLSLHIFGSKYLILKSQKYFFFFFCTEYGFCWFFFITYKTSHHEFIYVNCK